MPKTYSDKLRDPRWQKKRLEILERDGWKCKGCGDKKSTLNVHHLYYEAYKDPWDYPDKALKTLCEKCHEDEHFLEENGFDLDAACARGGFLNQNKDLICMGLSQSVFGESKKWDAATLIHFALTSKDVLKYTEKKISESLKDGQNP